MLHEPNPSGLPNSDVRVPSFNATRLLRRTGYVDSRTSVQNQESTASAYQKTFQVIRKHVREIHPKRMRNREALQGILVASCEARPGTFAALAPLPRFLLVTPAVSSTGLFAGGGVAATGSRSIVFATC